ncbi:MAG: spore cortex biosynthesis protein YabQ [Clostridia bacterium]|nr:spore cortex biosynthesis protein YabQ [Clostridia bacterium]
MITGFEHTVQLAVLLKAAGAGYIIGLFYSVVMFLNAMNGRNTVLVFLRDILFFASAAFFTFLFSLKYNAGIVRFYILAGEGIGFCLFYIFPGSAMGKVWRGAAKRIQKVFRAFTAKQKEVINRIKSFFLEKIKLRKKPKKLDFSHFFKLRFLKIKKRKQSKS